MGKKVKEQPRTRLLVVNMRARNIPAKRITYKEELHGYTARQRAHNSIANTGNKNGHLISLNKNVM